MRRLLVMVAVTAIVLAAAAVYAADDFTITNNGWTYREHNIDKPGNQQAAGQPTNFFFQNEGNDVMQQNWWWFRAGGTGELALTNQTGFTQLAPNAVQLTYLQTAANGAPLQFVLNYTLTGISPTAASVEIDWTATNTSTTLSTPLDVFSYTNTKLLPNPNQQNVMTVGAFSATTDSMEVTSDTNPTIIDLVAQGAGSSPLVGWRVDDFKNLLNDLTDNTNTNFSTASQSLTNVNAEAGFQWANANLGPGGQTGGILFKNVSSFAPPIPDASTLVLAASGALSLLALRRRRR